LYDDYSKGLDAENIRWSIWSSSVWTPTSILIDLSSSVPFLRIGSVAGVYSQGTSRLDVAAAIPSTVRTALAAVGNGTVGHYHSVRFRANGSGTLDCYLYPEDVGSSTQLASTTLASAPAKDYTLLANFINEKCAVEFKVTEANEWFSLSRLDLYAKIIWASRPI
jgi:hypothetical protein